MARGPDRRVALLSLHPRFAGAILRGEKRVELRKAAITADVSHVVMYATAPLQRVVGWFEVAGVERDHPAQLWRRHRQEVGVSASEFHRYFDDAKLGTAIRVGRVVTLVRPVPLRRLGSFAPPQSLQYLDSAVLTRLRRSTP